MRFALVVTLLSCVAFAAAHITGVSGPKKYAPTASSTYPLKFSTVNGPITKYADLFISQKGAK